MTRSPCCRPGFHRDGTSKLTANGSIVIDSELGGVIELQSYFMQYGYRCKTTLPKYQQFDRITKEHPAGPVQRRMPMVQHRVSIVQHRVSIVQHRVSSSRRGPWAAEAGIHVVSSWIRFAGLRLPFRFRWLQTTSIHTTRSNTDSTWIPACAA